MKFQAKYLRVQKENHQILRLQKLLKKLGFNIDGKEGLWEESTTTALKQFQEREKLPASGKANAATVKKLNQLWEEYKPILWDGYTLTGRVINSEDSLPITGFILEAWDRDKRRDDLLGRDIINQKGEYRIVFEGRHMPDKDQDPSPDLFFRVFDEEQRLVFEDRKNARKDIEPGLHNINLEIKIDGAKYDNYFNVTGQLRRPDGTGIPNLVVKAFDKGVGKETELGYSSSQKDGFFNILYRLDKLPDGKQQADIVLKVFEHLGKEIPLTTSALYVDSPPHQEIGIELTKKQYKGVDLFQQISGEVKSILPISIFRSPQTSILKEDDISYLAKKLRRPSKEIKDYLKANQLEKQYNIPSKVFYALAQRHISIKIETFLEQGESKLKQVLNEAANEGIISIEHEEISQIAESLVNKSIESIYHEHHPVVSLVKMEENLGTNKIRKKQTKAFIQFYARNNHREKKFWDNLPNSTGIHENKTKDLQFAFDLYDLTNGSLKLVEAIRKQGVSSARQMIDLNYKDFLDEKMLAIVADKIQPELERRHPTAFFAHQLEQGIAVLPKESYNQEALSDFFSKNPEFDFHNTNIVRFLDNNPTALKDAKNPEALRQQLTVLGRYFNTTPTQNRVTTISSLTKMGLDSAFSIQRMPRSSFVRKYAEVSTETDTNIVSQTAQSIYRRARRISNTALMAYSKYGAAFNSVSMYALPALQPPENGQAKANGLATYSNDNGSDDISSDSGYWRKLFDALDYWHCEHSQSTYSPAAYLADILLFLEDASGSDSEYSYLETLLSRRPDLTQILLNTPNAMTEMPYLDLVNEILENEIAKQMDESGFEIPYDPSFLDKELLERKTIHQDLKTNIYKVAGIKLSEEAKIYQYEDREEIFLIIDRSYVIRLTREEEKPEFSASVYYQTGDSALELKANPEHISIPPYTLLNSFQEDNPWILPFDLWGKTVNTYLNHLGLPRFQLMDKIIPESEDDKARQVASAFLELSKAELERFTENNLWEEEKGFKVKKLMKLSGLTYSEITDILKTRFVNPKGNKIDFNISEEDDSLNIEKHEIELTHGRIRVEQFWRILQKVPWSVEELDKVICLLIGGPNENFENQTLIDIANILRIQKKINIPILYLMSFWRDLDTVSNENNQSVYEELFLKPLEKTVSREEEREKNEDLLQVFEELISSKKDAGSNPGYLNDPRNGKGEKPQKEEPTAPNIFEREESGDYKYLPTIQGATKLNQEDFLFIRNKFEKGKEDKLDINHHNQIALTLGNLSFFFALGKLCRSLRISVKEYYLFQRFFGDESKNFPEPIRRPNNPNKKSAPADTLAFLEAIELLKETGISVEELAYVLQHYIEHPSGQPPIQKEILIELTELQQELRKIINEAQIDNINSEDLLRAQLEAFPELFNDIYSSECLIGSNTASIKSYDCLRKIWDIIIGNSTLTPDEQASIINSPRFRRIFTQENTVQKLVDPGWLKTEGKRKYFFLMQLPKEFLSEKLDFQILAKEFFSDPSDQDIFNKIFADEPIIQTNSNAENLIDSNPKIFSDSEQARLSLLVNKDKKERKQYFLNQLSERWWRKWSDQSIKPKSIIYHIIASFIDTESEEFTICIDVLTKQKDSGHEDFIKSNSPTNKSDDGTENFIFPDRSLAIQRLVNKGIIFDLEERMKFVGEGLVQFFTFDDKKLAEKYLLVYQQVKALFPNDYRKALAIIVGTANSKGDAWHIEEQEQIAFIRSEFSNHIEASIAIDRLVNSPIKPSLLLEKLNWIWIQLRLKPFLVNKLSEIFDLAVPTLKSLIGKYVQPITEDTEGVEVTDDSQIDFYRIKLNHIEVEGVEKFDKNKYYLRVKIDNKRYLYSQIRVFGPRINPFPSSFKKLLINLDFDFENSIRIELWEEDPKDLNDYQHPGHFAQYLVASFEVTKDEIGSEFRYRPKGVKAFYKLDFTKKSLRRVLKTFLLEDAFLHDSYLETSEIPLNNPELFPEQIISYQQLDKLSKLIQKLNIQTDDLAYIFEVGPKIGWIDLGKLPIKVDVQNPGSKNWEGLKRIIQTFKLQKHLNRYTSDRFNIIDFLGSQNNQENINRDDLIQSINEALGWNILDLEKLFDHYKFESYIDEGYMITLHNVFSCINLTGGNAQQLISLAQNVVNYPQAQLTQNLVKAKYDQKHWLEVAREINNQLRVAKRDALQAYLTTYPPEGKEFQDAADLYAHYLIDTEMSPCFMTSRIKQAISSVQLYIQRILMNLEPGLNMDPELAEEWNSWRKNYRVWEANRKVFLYPENWIEPELRDDKTPFFKELEEELLQDDMNAETAERAYRNYLTKLNEVSRLDVRAEYYDEENKELHVFARTFSEPYIYYYRKWYEESRVWTPWERIDLDIEGDHLIPVVHQGELILFWPIFKPKTERIPNLKDDDDKEVAIKYFDIFLAWSSFKKQWDNPKRTTIKLSINDILKNKKSYFADLQEIEGYLLDKSKYLFLANYKPDNDDDFFFIKCYFTGLWKESVINYSKSRNDNHCKTLLGEFRFNLLNQTIDSINQIILDEALELCEQQFSPPFNTFYCNNRHQEKDRKRKSFYFSVDSITCINTLEENYNDLVKIDIIIKSYLEDKKEPQEIEIKVRGNIDKSPIEGSFYEFEENKKEQFSSREYYKILDSCGKPDIEFRFIVKNGNKSPNFIRPIFRDSLDLQSFINEKVITINRFTNDENDPNNIPTTLIEYKIKYHFYELSDIVWLSNKEPTSSEKDNYDVPFFSKSSSSNLLVTDLKTEEFVSTPLFFISSGQTFFMNKVNNAYRFDLFSHPYSRFFVSHTYKYGIHRLLNPKEIEEKEKGLIRQKMHSQIIGYRNVVEPIYQLELERLICYKTHEIIHKGYEEDECYLLIKIDPEENNNENSSVIRVPESGFVQMDSGDTWDISNSFYFKDKVEVKLMESDPPQGSSHDPLGEVIIQPSKSNRGVKVFNNLGSYYEIEYKICSKVHTPHPKEEIDFHPQGAYSLYNWELFFHIPLMIANRLSQNQKFNEAQKWFHAIFDPTVTRDRNVTLTQFWKIKPFIKAYDEEAVRKSIEDFFIDREENVHERSFGAQITMWEKDPFNPHLVARNRISAYMKTVVMKYLDNLTAWADQLFQRFSIESLNEATQLYMIGEGILGRKPEEVPGKKKVELTFANIYGLHPLQMVEDYVSAWDPDPHDGEQGLNLTNEQSESSNLNSIFYFCFPHNRQLIKYWETVSDRLFKIRNCMNMEGEVQKLALYEPPIDPALLVRAKAMGMDLNSILNTSNGALPNYRFQYMLPKALEFCQEVKALGASLLAAMEKKDAEELSLLRTKHEKQILKSIRNMKQLAIEEAEIQMESTKFSQELIKNKHKFYL